MAHLSTATLLLRGAVVLVLVAANAFFVAAEFALVAARRTRIDAMVRRGDRKAKTVQSALQDLYGLLSATQLGITLASILLGYVAEDTVALLLRDLVDRWPAALQWAARAGIASTVAIGTVSFMHVVFGELVPKAWAITYPEAVSRWIAAPLTFFARIARPFTFLLNRSSRLLLRILGLPRAAGETERIHSPEEIVMLAQQSQRSGALEKSDVRLIEGVFEFTEKTARDVMTPRTEIIALPADLTVDQAAERIAAAGRSRYPVYQSSPDEVIGMVHAKQILAMLRTDPQRRLATIVREPLFVPGTAEVEDVLADMKRRKVHLAVVLDEYGGTAGLVTMEDLIEEIVGKIYDEYDRGDQRGADASLIAGSLALEDANVRFGFGITSDDYQTIGGWVFGKLGRLPKRGDKVTVRNGALEVVEMQGRRVARLRFVAIKEQNPAATAPAGESP
jgi:CBS domain containing-hemolysin-like protein